MALDIEIILSRQLADSLSVPVFIVEPNGTLLFYNEPAEHILGKRFNDTGAMPAAEWATLFEPYDDEGNKLLPKELPLVKTLYRQEPAHGTFWIKSLNGSVYKISVTSYPIIGRAKRFSGAVAIFWTDQKQDEN
jgi:PAS domain-containing protein